MNGHSQMTGCDVLVSIVAENVTRMKRGLQEETFTMADVLYASAKAKPGPQPRASKEKMDILNMTCGRRTAK
jgi:hypothetical protein